MLKLSILCFLVLFFSCGQEIISKEKELIRPAKYPEVNPSGSTARLEYSGRITTAREVQTAFEVPGRIVTFPVQDAWSKDDISMIHFLDTQNASLVADNLVIKTRSMIFLSTLLSVNVPPADFGS